MRIALVHTRILHRGGLETRLFSYMKFLRDAGHEVTVIVYRVGRGVKVPEGVRVIHVRIPYIPKVYRAKVFDNRLGAILDRETFDFVLSLGRTSHHDAVLLPGNHLGYLRAMGKVATGLSDKLQIYMDRRAYAAPGRILACSQMMKDEVVELYGADPEKIEILYPPTDTQRFHLGLKERKAELRGKYGFSKDKLSFLLVSASHKRKGLPLLMEVFGRLVDQPFELWVAGGEAVPGHFPNVKGLGFVKETEELYAAADCTLLPAVYEPYGQVVSESILCGTPVMVSGMVGAKSVISNRVGEVIESFAVGEWERMIRGFAPEKYHFDEGFAVQHKLELGGHIHAIMKKGEDPNGPFPVGFSG